MDELIYALWLAARKKLSDEDRQRLLSTFGDAKAIFRAEQEALAPFGLSEGVKAALADKDVAAAEATLERCQQAGIDLLPYGSAAYPQRLADIYCAPSLLYVRGKLPALDDVLCVAIVGSRSCGEYGSTVAQKLSFELAARGVVVVSGMARGIDGMAHRGALKAGNSTLAVLGCGVDVPYPKEHARMMDYIVENGAVLSEYPPGTSPMPAHFPARNRIIAGLCAGVLVVEAHDKSGALITANLALQQGRDVFAVPGNITDWRSGGCNALIQDGAKLVTCGDDILNEYQSVYGQSIRTSPRVQKLREPRTPPAPKMPEKKSQSPFKKPYVLPGGVDRDEQRILLALGDAGLSADALCQALCIEMDVLLAALMGLELEGHVQKLPGNHFKRTSEV